MKNKNTKLKKLFVFIAIKYPILHIILIALFGFVLVSIANNTKLDEYKVFYYDAPASLNENPHIELEFQAPMDSNSYEGFWVVKNEEKHHLSATLQGSNKLSCVLDEVNNIDAGQQITLYINIGDKTLLEKFIDNIGGAHERD